MTTTTAMIPASPDPTVPVKHPMARNPEVWTKEKIGPVLIRARGNLTVTARLLSQQYGRPCSVTTISRKVSKHPELQEAKALALTMVCDICEEDTFNRALIEKNQRDQHWILGTFRYGRQHHQTATIEGEGSFRFTVESLGLGDAEQNA